MEANVNFFKLNSKNKRTESATRSWAANYRKWAQVNGEEVQRHDCLFSPIESTKWAQYFRYF